MKSGQTNRSITVVKSILKRIYTKAVAGIVFLFFLSVIIALLANTRLKQAATIIWELDNPALIGGIKPVILGNPSVVRDGTGTALSFNGVDDGLILPVNPIKNWKSFTVEVLFKPAADGPSAPRFVHFQDTVGNRGTFELRLTPKGYWYADTFLKNGKAGPGAT